VRRLTQNACTWKPGFSKGLLGPPLHKLCNTFQRDSTSYLCRRANSGVQPHNQGTTASQHPEASLSVAVSTSPPPHAAPAYAYPSPHYAAPLGGVVTWTSVFIVSCLTLTTLAGSFIAAVLYIKPMLEAAEKASLQANIAALQMEKAAQVC
jgi:hypothetical protein